MDLKDAGSPGEKWFFFELMPCALEAQTVIQNVLSLIDYSHMLENRWEQKARCLPKQNPNNTTKNQRPTKKQDKQHKKTPRKLGETLRFQKKSPQAAQYCFAMS